MALFAVAEIALFAVSGPINAGYMWSVPPQLKPLACALTTVIIHVFGDVPSPPLAGMYTLNPLTQSADIMKCATLGLSIAKWKEMGDYTHDA